MENIDNTENRIYVLEDSTGHQFPIDESLVFKALQPTKQKGIDVQADLSKGDVFFVPEETRDLILPILRQADTRNTSVMGRIFNLFRF